MSIEVFASTIGYGTHHGRKLVGLRYFSDFGLSAHTSLQCGYVDAAVADKLPVIEEGGQMYVLREGQQASVKECDNCPGERGDPSWRERAQCAGTTLDAFSTNAAHRAEFIAANCDVCPVVGECLESGAMMDTKNSGAIWGGVYFYAHGPERRAAIKEKRKELANG